jgi:hypothetical protein
VGCLQRTGPEAIHFWDVGRKEAEDQSRWQSSLASSLYMPALVAIRHEPFVRGFYQHLLRRRKAPLQAVVAVMRKLLHAFFAMFQLDQPYDGSKLCPTELTLDTVAA